MGEKIGDLTVSDMKVAIALEERNKAVNLAEVKFSEKKLKLLYEALAEKDYGTEGVPITK